MDSKRFGVNAAPNESKIRGQIVKIEPGPEGLGWTWKIEVSETEDIDNLPNFARRYGGKLISVLIHPEMKKEVKESDFIEAHISFQGDESGGSFFLIDDNVRIIHR